MPVQDEVPVHATADENKIKIGMEKRDSDEEDRDLIKMIKNIMYQENKRGWIH